LVADFPRRGQIHWVDFDPIKGSEQGGRRPAIIVSNEIANQHSSVVVVVPMSTAPQKRAYPQNVAFHATNPLPEAGTAYCGQVRTVSKDRLDGYRADASTEQMALIDKALAVALGLRSSRIS
jgi:mRNA interferase MazF